MLLRALSSSLFLESSLFFWSFPSCVATSEFLEFLPFWFEKEEGLELDYFPVLWVEGKEAKKTVGNSRWDGTISFLPRSRRMLEFLLPH